MWNDCDFFKYIKNYLNGTIKFILNYKNFFFFFCKYIYSDGDLILLLIIGEGNLLLSFEIMCEDGYDLNRK